MSDAAQIEQQLSMQAAQLMRAAIMIARALAAREAAARRAAAHASLEHARALRTVTEQQRRLAAPLYRAARREGWWDDPKVSAAERARAVGLATRFEHVDEDARAVALEARQRLERQARAHAEEQERARMAARNPETFRDSGKEAFIDMTLVSVAIPRGNPRGNSHRSANDEHAAVGFSGRGCGCGRAQARGQEARSIHRLRTDDDSAGQTDVREQSRQARDERERTRVG